jgi:hypothetical protein
MCKNCEETKKIFALAVTMTEELKPEAFKFGEYPAFGPPTPSRVLDLLGDDKDLFLQGRQCENHGLGIGAFTYYRRVVESQWKKLVQEIIDVAPILSTSPEIIEKLEHIRENWSFNKSVTDGKDAIPPTLLIKEQNPLKMLHELFSKGVHNLSDEECLSRATKARTILGVLVERMKQAVESDQEINDAFKSFFDGQSEEEKQ